MRENQGIDRTKLKENKDGGWKNRSRVYGHAHAHKKGKRERESGGWES